MQTAVVLVALLVSGCSSMTPGQRIGLYCNPVAQAVDVVIIGLVLAELPLYLYVPGRASSSSASGNSSGLPIQNCIQAIKDKVRQAEIEKSEAVDCPALDPETHELLPRCDLVVAPETPQQTTVLPLSSTTAEKTEEGAIHD